MASNASVVSQHDHRSPRSGDAHHMTEKYITVSEGLVPRQRPTFMRFLERKFLDDYPHAIGVGISGMLSVFSLGPTPGLIPIIFTLSILLIYSRKIFPIQAPHKSRHTIILWVVLTIGSSVLRITPSIHALSQPVLSILSLLILSGITSALCIGALFIETRVSSWMSPKDKIVRLLLFPTWWTTVWAAIAYLSPLGMLSTWNPVEGTSAYNWMLPILGPQSLNWVVAAWAVVISEILMSLYMGSEFRDEEDFNPLIPTTTGSGGNDHHNMAIASSENYNVACGNFSTRDAIMLLAAFLVLLIVPSFSINSLPVPLGDVSIATPLTVGCALPTVDEYHVPNFSFSHYLRETKRLDSTVNFILWPESAVHFESEADRNHHLDKIREQIHHAFVGVSFDETLADTENRHGIKRNGIAIVSNQSDTPHLVYFKRHLVPIAESFSLTHSPTPPTTFKAEIQYKKYPIEGHKRDVIVTTSICLDFSDPSLFKSLEVRPGLILAPGRTWDVTVGYAMWKQASQRAHEIDSSLLWCDGGEGGVSGVVGRGMSEVFQVGAGSWVRTIGVQHPFNEQRRTVYAQYGNSVLLLFWALLSRAPIGRVLRAFFEKVKRRHKVTSGTPDVPEVSVGNLIGNDE